MAVPKRLRRQTEDDQKNRWLWMIKMKFNMFRQKYPVRAAFFFVS